MVKQTFGIFNGVFGTGDGGRWPGLTKSTIVWDQGEDITAVVSSQSRAYPGGIDLAPRLLVYPREGIGAGMVSLHPLPMPDSVRVIDASRVVVSWGPVSRLFGIKWPKFEDFERHPFTPFLIEAVTE